MDSRSSRRPAHAVYVFSPEQTLKHPERAWLGDTPPPLQTHTHTHTHKSLGEVIDPPALARRSQQGLLMVTCAPSAPSQSPVSQMRAGSPPPTSPTPPFDSSCAAARLQESRQRREGRCRKTAGGALGSPHVPVRAWPRLLPPPR